MSYEDIYDLIHDYNRAIKCLNADFVNAPFLDVDRYKPKQEDKQIMYALIEIAFSLEDYFNKFEWFHLPNPNYPFNSMTPWLYIVKNKKGGLLETVFYVHAMILNKLPQLPLPDAINTTNELFNPLIPEDIF